MCPCLSEYFDIIYTGAPWRWWCCCRCTVYIICFFFDISCSVCVVYVFIIIYAAKCECLRCWDRQRRWMMHVCAQYITITCRRAYTPHSNGWWCSLSSFTVAFTLVSLLRIIFQRKRLNESDLVRECDPIVRTFRGRAHKYRISLSLSHSPKRIHTTSNVIRSDTRTHKSDTEPEPEYIQISAKCIEYECETNGNLVRTADTLVLLFVVNYFFCCLAAAAAGVVVVGGVVRMYLIHM